MTTVKTVSVRVTRRFSAPAERVFDAWLDPSKARQWFGPGLGDMVRAEIDARVGGSFWLVQRRGDVDVAHTGEYLQIDRPRRLAFTWRMLPEPDTSRVTVEIVPQGGGCELTLTHEIGAEWADYTESVQVAWSTMTGVIDAIESGASPS
jgi:uncharacterized protein YndB with AHSA1/START domain